MRPTFSRSVTNGIRRPSNHLLETGAAYRDFATSAEIQVRAGGGAAGQASGSSTAAAGWPRPASRRSAFEPKGRTAIVRLKMPRAGSCEFD